MSADTGNGFKIKAEQLCKQHMPPMSGLAGAIGAGGWGLSATSASVVSRVLAMEAAFSRAERDTLVGSTMPAGIMSQYSSL